jgi:hypothetical protein
MAGCSVPTKKEQTMERKGTAVVTAEEVEAALETAPTTTTEDKVLRMRFGAKVKTTTVLPRAAGANDELADELLLLEMRLLSAYKMRLKAQAPKNQARDKIVRALRKKS